MMRQGPHTKRLRGRGNGRKNVNPRSQNFDSSGPEVKVRGNAQQVVEKYLQLARDATLSGDRVTAESYFQHAEHYFRVMNANGPPSNGQNNGQNTGQNSGQNSGQDGNNRDGRNQQQHATPANDGQPEEAEVPGEGPQPEVSEDPGAASSNDDTDGTAPASA